MQATRSRVELQRERVVLELECLDRTHPAMFQQALDGASAPEVPA